MTTHATLIVVTDAQSDVQLPRLANGSVCYVLNPLDKPIIVHAHKDVEVAGWGGGKRFLMTDNDWFAA